MLLKILLMAISISLKWYFVLNLANGARINGNTLVGSKISHLQDFSVVDTKQNGPVS